MLLKKLTSTKSDSQYNQTLWLLNTETQFYVCFEVVFSPKQGQIVGNTTFVLQVL